MNEERVYLKLASDSSSDNDEEKHFKSTKAVANKSRKNSSVSNVGTELCILRKTRKCAMPRQNPLTSNEEASSLSIQKTQANL